MACPAVMSGKALHSQVWVERNPASVNHVLEQGPVQHHCLLAKAVSRQVLHDALVGPRGAGEDGREDDVRRSENAGLAKRLPVLGQVADEVKNALAGLSLSNQRVAVEVR